MHTLEVVAQRLEVLRGGIPVAHLRGQFQRCAKVRQQPEPVRAAAPRIL